MSEKTITVGGMTCGGCEQSIVRALSQLSGVRTVEADHVTGAVVLTGDAIPDDAAIVGAVEGAGYDVLPDGRKTLPLL